MSERRIIQGRCNFCLGDGKDNKKRSRKCPNCRGTGQMDYCYSCGEQMNPRCGGRDPSTMDGFIGDPPPCLRRGRSDRRTYNQITGDGIMNKIPN